MKNFDDFFSGEEIGVNKKIQKLKVCMNSKVKTNIMTPLSETPHTMLYLAGQREGFPKFVLGFQNFGYGF